MEHDEQNGMDPARIGRCIAGIVEKKNPAVVYVAGAQYKFLSLLCKLLPAAAAERSWGKSTVSLCLPNLHFYFVDNPLFFSESGNTANPHCNYSNVYDTLGRGRHVFILCDYSQSQVLRS